MLVDSSGNGHHGTIHGATWVATQTSSDAFLAQGGRKIDAWYAALKVIEVSFDDEADAFRNINTLEELRRE